MKLAMYKGRGTFYDKLIRFVTNQEYSHCELVIDDICYSSQPRDGGVRMKYIHLDKENWDVYPIVGDKTKALTWFIENVDAKYDWLGAVMQVLPFQFNIKSRFFCSEACADMLGLPNAKKYTPISLLREVA